MAPTPSDPRRDNPAFFARNAHILVAGCWLLAAAMRAVDALRTGATGAWLGAAGFAGVALLNYVCFRQLRRKRLQAR